MRNRFVEKVLSGLLDQGVLRRDHRILTVCSGQPERDIFVALGFNNVTISNLDEREWGASYPPYEWSFQNAMQMTFADRQFDFAFVSDGLHHCSSPHRAVLEMYRVSKLGVIVIESRDSLLMRWAMRLGLSLEYEVGSVEYHGGRQGGVDNTEIPNYIYRWTEREFQKTIESADPVGRHRFVFVHGLNPPTVSGPLWSRIGKHVLIALLTLALTVAKRQGNGFAMIALRPRVPGDLWPWLREENGRIVFASQRGS